MSMPVTDTLTVAETLRLAFDDLLANGDRETVLDTLSVYSAVSDRIIEAVTLGEKVPLNTEGEGEALAVSRNCVREKIADADLIEVDVGANQAVGERLVLTLGLAVAETEGESRGVSEKDVVGEPVNEGDTDTEAVVLDEKEVDAEDVTVNIDVTERDGDSAPEKETEGEPVGECDVRGELVGLVDLDGVTERVIAPLPVVKVVEDGKPVEDVRTERVMPEERDTELTLEAVNDGVGVTVLLLLAETAWETLPLGDLEVRGDSEADWEGETVPDALPLLLHDSAGDADSFGEFEELPDDEAHPVADRDAIGERLAEDRADGEPVAPMERVVVDDVVTLLVLAPVPVKVAEADLRVLGEADCEVVTETV